MLDSNLMGISLTPNNMADTIDYYDLAIVSLVNGQVVNLIATKTKYCDLGGWFSPLLTSRALQIVTPSTNSSSLKGSQILIQVKAHKDAGLWNNATISGVLTNNIANNINITGLNDNGVLGDNLANDGIYSKFINLPNDTGKFTFKFSSSYTENNITNTIVSDSAYIYLYNPVTQYQISPSILNFGQVIIGDTSVKSIWITNTGNTNINGQLTVNTPFHIFGNSNINIIPSQTIEVKIKLIPNTIGNFSSNLLLSSISLSNISIIGEGIVIGTPPIINNIPNHSTNENTQYMGPVPSLFSGTLPVIWELNQGASGMTLDSLTGIIHWNNPSDSSQPYLISIKATNTFGNDTESWYLNVLPDSTIVPISISGNLIYINDTLNSLGYSVALGGQKQDTCYTDSLGFYKFDSLVVGDYYVTVKATGIYFLPDSIMFDSLYLSVFNQNIYLLKNSYPLINDTTFTLYENPNNGFLIGQINASDPDNDSLTFQIVSGNIGQTFLLHPTQGILNVIDSTLLDYELDSLLYIKVRVNDNNLVNLSDSAIITIKLLDVFELNAFKTHLGNPDIIIYPNPNNGKFTFSFNNINNLEKLQYEIFDITGRMIDNREVDLIYPSANVQIKIPHKSKGIYLLRVYIDNQRYDFKLVVI